MYTVYVDGAWCAEYKTRAAAKKAARAVRDHNYGDVTVVVVHDNGTIIFIAHKGDVNNDD